MRKVLDAWAVLAWLLDTPGAAARVRQVLEDSARGRLDLRMSAINFGEVYYILAKRAGVDRADAFVEDARGLPIRRLPVPRELVMAAARLKAAHPISYADAFAVATAVRERATLITGDPDLHRFVGGDVADVEWIGA